MDTYYVRGKGYDFRTQSEAFYEIAFDVDSPQEVELKLIEK